MPTENQRRLIHLRRDLHNLHQQLDRNLRHLTSLAAVYQDALAEDSLCQLHNVGVDLDKVGRRLSDIGTTLQDVSFETAGRDLKELEEELDRERESSGVAG